MEAEDQDKNGRKKEGKEGSVREGGKERRKRKKDRKKETGRKGGRKKSSTKIAKLRTHEC